MMSDAISRGRKALQRIHQRNEDARWVFGTMGRLVDGVPTFDVTGRSNFVLVTIRQANGSQTSVPARNDANVPKALGLPLRMRLEGTTYIIDSIARRSDLAYTSPGQDPDIHTHDQRYFTETEHIAVSVGAADAGKPVKTNASGLVDNTLLAALAALYVALTGNQNVEGLKSFLDGIYVETDGTNARIERKTTATGGSLRVAIELKATSTGSVADGFGPALFFGLNDLETGAVDNFLASIGAGRDGADNTGKIILRAYKAGVSTVVGELNSNGQLTIFGNVLGGVVQRLTTAATNDDPTQEVSQGRIATTGSTPTTLQTIPVPASHACQLEVVVTARRTGGASGTAEDCAAYVLRGLYKNVAGTATLVGAVVQTVVGESVAGYDATLVVSGGDVLVQVVGIATTNITWHCTTRHWFLST